MKIASPDDLFKQFPELEIIANRLHDSEQEYLKQQNGEKKEEKSEAETTSFHDDTDKKVKHERNRYPEHFLVKEYNKGGKWIKTAYSTKYGRTAFLEVLTSLINAIDADAIRLKIFSGKKESEKPVYEREFWFTTGEQLDIENNEQKKSNENLGLAGEIEGLKQQLLQFTDPSVKQPENINSLKADFAFQLEKLEWKREKQAILEKAERDKEKITEVYEKKIEKLENEIEELEDELDEADDELGAVQAEIEKKEENPMVGLIAKAGEKLIIELAANNPEIPKAIGLAPEEMKKILARYNKKLSDGSEHKVDGEATFEFTEDELKGLDPKQAEGIKIITQVCKILPIDKFLKIYYLFQFIADDKGQPDMEKIEKAYAMLVALGEQEKQAA